MASILRPMFNWPVFRSERSRTSSFCRPTRPATNAVEATLKVQKEFQGRPITEYIRTDSTAQLVATSVLGNEKMINITPGTIQGQPITENAVLESSTPVSINQLTATGNDLLKQINKLAVPANEILNKANRGEGTLGRLVNDESLYRNLDTDGCRNQGHDDASANDSWTK